MPGSRPPAAPDAGPLAPWLDLVPLAWLALVAYGWLMLLQYPASPDRPHLPGVQAANRAVVPLLCLIGLTAIIKHFALRPRPARTASPAEAAKREGPATP